jgi:hypothetical protein
MKQLVITADLLIKNTDNECISINNKDGALVINFEGRSVPTIPIKWLWEARKYTSLNRYISHPILIKVNGKTLYTVDQGKTKVKDYLLGIRILLKSLFTT